ncbi:MAG: TonB-dependent receptor [Prevotellaceae bacterium]|nr:TonB-dependent receptor [Candidatus Minthosoma caballi]
MQRRYLVLFSFILVAAVAFAQNMRKVTGTVFDEFGDPLPGATVVVKNNTTIGAACDIEGKFSLDIPSNTKLLSVGFVGMQSQDIAPVFGKAMRIVLREDAKLVDEVVVMGYGSAKKLGSVTGSVATVGGEKIENVPTANFTDALQGQVAGLSVLSSSGEPTASATIRLRGVNSLTAGNEPLFILDGAPISNDVFNALNPSDIANVTVLKDAASTAIYGSRAANGVIVLTSKKGKMEQKPTVKISAQYGVANIINSGTKMMNSKQYMKFRELVDPSLATNSEWLEHKNVVTKNGISTNWMDEIYRNNAPTFQLNASLMGGSANTNYYLSLNHMNREGIEPLSKATRESIRFNEDIRVAPMFKVGVDMNLSYNNSQTNPEQNASGIYATNPTVFTRLARPDDAPYYYTVNSDGSINKRGRADFLHYSGTAGSFFNPNWMAEFRTRESKTVHLDGNIYEELSPIPGLKIRAVQALAAYDDKYTALMEPKDAYESPMGDKVDVYGDGSAPYRTESSDRWYQFTSSNTAEYIFNLQNKHNFSVLLGEETIYSKMDGFAASREGLSDPRMLLLTNATEEPTVTHVISETVFNSVFSQASYNYAEKYFLNASIRRDGSSRFSKKHRWSTFWSLGGRWNMMKESFMSPMKSWLNQLDVKASYGTTGNSSIGDYIYMGLASSQGVQYDGNGGLVISQQSIDDLTWESVAQTNLGVEFRVFDRLSVGVDYYYKKTTDMLLSIPYSYTTGFTSGMGNIGSMSNEGIDVSLNLDILRKKDMAWSFYANVNYNSNKVKSLFNGLDEYVIAGTGQKLQVGKSFGEFYLVKRAGIDPRDGSQMWYDADGNLTKNYNEEENSQFTGKNRFAPWSGGFGSTFSWKGLNVSTDLTWALGKYAMNNDRYFFENAQFGQSFNQSESMLNIWTTPGQITDIPAATETIQMDDHVLENASFLRLKRLTIGYNLPKQWIAPTKYISNVNVFVTGRNLLTFTKYTGYDPEPDSNVIQFNYPNTREFLIGCEITF